MSRKKNKTKKPVFVLNGWGQVGEKSVVKYQSCYKMFVMMLVKMFVVFVLVASSYSRICFDVVDVLDCSGAGLKDLEPIYNGHYNLSAVKSLFLQGNNIRRVNFSKIV